MAKVKNLINNEKSFEVTFEISKDEISNDFNTLDNFNIISDQNISYGSKLVKRGKNESTLYFLIPKELRKDIKVKKNGKNLFKMAKISKDKFIIVREK